MTRRDFLTGSAGTIAALGGAGSLVDTIRSALGGGKPAVHGSIQGAAASIGHLLRDRQFPPPSEHVTCGIVIIGGGIAGLGAAWKLDKSGYHDFMLLELEDEPGGNARSGRNAVSAYPWGAHYVPIPPPSARPVIELFEELGVIESYDAAERPVYNERYLCAEPHERLLLRGQWQEGLVPRLGRSAGDEQQFDGFFREMQRWKNKRGQDGRRAFAIPIDASSRDADVLALDRITMADYMQRNGWDAPLLRWYVNYCCRDDYGCTLENTSAWAGIHYFAARAGTGANAVENAVLTWPEGNGWLVNELARRVRPQIHTGSLVINVDNNAGGVLVDYYDVARHCTVRVVGNAAIVAAPRFVAAKLLPVWRATPPPYLADFTYAPWLVANVTVNDLPLGNGAPLAWDNVSVKSDSLGYVVATHQEIRRYPRREAVLTYYLPLTRDDPREARAAALARSYDDWRALVLADLETMHAGISGTVSQLDVWLWGHGMIRPLPGFIWGAARRWALDPIGKIWFAHSDMSGISIFEEALHRGVTAAEAVMAELGTPFRSSLEGAR